MAQENWQKYKLLKLLELLRQETDEQNPLPTSAICNRLAEMGISCERRTLTKDIAVLNELGYEVMWNWVGKEKGYYIEDRSFSVPELKILIDAVQAASFITEKKTAELIDKIAELGGTHKADILKGNMVCFNTRKHSNESIYYNVGYLEDAIQQQKKVIFYYYDLNENGEKVYRREHHHYVVEPIALVFNEDNYYLMVYSARHDGTANYRVDRIPHERPADMRNLRIPPAQARETCRQRKDGAQLGLRKPHRKRQSRVRQSPHKRRRPVCHLPRSRESHDRGCWGAP